MRRKKYDRWIKNRKRGGSYKREGRRRGRKDANVRPVTVPHQAAV